MRCLMWLSLALVTLGCTTPTVSTLIEIGVPDGGVWLPGRQNKLLPMPGGRARLPRPRRPPV
jgi:hypothetical protein